MVRDKSSPVALRNFCKRPVTPSADNPVASINCWRVGALLPFSKNDKIVLLISSLRLGGRSLLMDKSFPVSLRKRTNLPFIALMDSPVALAICSVVTFSLFLNKDKIS